MQELFPLADSHRERDWKNNIFFLELFKDTDMEEDMDKKSKPFLEKNE